MAIRKAVLYGIVHLLVDAATVGLLFTTLRLHQYGPERSFYAVLLYNALAFGLQPVIGIATDLLKKPKTTMLVGIGLVLLSLCFYQPAPDAAIVLTALGNAAFHVGAGVIAFFFTPGRATGPGIFVGPGALGLGAGTFLGKGGFYPAAAAGLLLLAAGIVLALVPIPPTYAERAKLKIKASLPALAFGVLFLLIFARSFIGVTSGYSLAKGLTTLALLSVAGCAGKAAGGIIADRWGWLKVTVTALVISSPLIAFAGTNVLVGAAGVLLFQAAMPVTLTATAGIIPRTPGLAFGVNCLALFLGMLVDFSPVRYTFYHSGFQAAAVVVTAGLLFAGLWLLRRRQGKQPAVREKKGRAGDQVEQE